LTILFPRCPVRATGKGKAVQIGRGPATVIGEPHPHQAFEPATVLLLNGKAEDATMTRKPGDLPGNS